MGSAPKHVTQQQPYDHNRFKLALIRAEVSKIEMII